MPSAWMADGEAVSAPGGWQKFVIDEGLQCVAESVFGINGFGESGLA
jgi:hypothetical protein